MLIKCVKYFTNISFVVYVLFVAQLIFFRMSGEFQLAMSADFGVSFQYGCAISSNIVIAATAP
jgi:hypothetical protein